MLADLKAVRQQLVSGRDGSCDLGVPDMSVVADISCLQVLWSIERPSVLPLPFQLVLLVELVNGQLRRISGQAVRLEVHHPEVLSNLALAEEVLQVEVLAHLQSLVPVAFFRIAGDGVSCIAERHVLPCDLRVHWVLVGRFSGSIHAWKTSWLRQGGEAWIPRSHIVGMQVPLLLVGLGLVVHLELVWPHLGFVPLVRELLRQGSIGLLADDLLSHGVGLSQLA